MNLSIIVCTRNRAHMLVTCLDSIAAAHAATVGIEVELVVVDNNSTDDTSNVVTEWALNSPLPVRLLVEPQKGLSAARNCGLRAALGEWIAFTDDDCRLSPYYILELIAHFQKDTEPTLRGGRVELGDPKDVALTIKTDDKKEDFVHPMHPAGFIHGANMTMSREVLDQIGLFDERFGAGTQFPGEDCDYVIRAAAAGLRVQYVPDMTVFHFHGRRNKREVKELFSGYMRANGALYIKHLRSSPLLIRHLWWDFCYWGKEIRGLDKKVLGDVTISHREVVMGNLWGILLFSLATAKDSLSNIFGRAPLQPKDIRCSQDQKMKQEKRNGYL